jgi:hypothetical protein
MDGHLLRLAAAEHDMNDDANASTKQAALVYVLVHSKRSLHQQTRLVLIIILVLYKACMQSFITKQRFVCLGY